MDRRARRVLVAIAALCLLTAQSPADGPTLACVPTPAPVGVATTCRGGPFDPGADVTITQEVDGAAASVSTRTVDEDGSVVKTYTFGPERLGSTVTITIQSTSDGNPVTVATSIVVVEAPTTPTPIPSPSGTPVPADDGDELADRLTTPVGIAVVAGTAVAIGLAVVVLVREQRTRRR